MEGDDVDLGLTDKVALVTGSYRGTGAGIARSLAGEGAVVLVHGLEPGQADEVASDIAAGGGRAHVVVGDIRSEDGTAAMVDAVRAQVDRVDIVVNNFGNTDHASDWNAADTATWHGSYDINVVSAFRVTQAFVPDMRAAGWGRVVVMSTIGATRPGDTIPGVLHREGRAAVDGGRPGEAPRGHRHHRQLREPGDHRDRRGRGELHAARRARRPRHRLGERAGTHPGRAHGEPDRTGADARRRRSLRDLRGERAAWHLNGAHLRLDGGASDAVT